MSPVETTLSSVSRALTSFHPRSMPRMARGHYRRELAAWMLIPFMMGAVEGGVASVIAKNVFTGSVEPRLLNLAVAVLAGAQGFANITSLLWASLSHGRHKIRFLVGLKVAAVILVGLIALAPRSPIGLVMLITGVVGARVCWAGVVTLRSTVWRVNYGRDMRATVTGKLATVQSIILTVVGLGIGAAMAYDENAFRVLFPAAALSGLLGTAIYRGLRVRGHRALMLAEQAGGTSERPSGNPLAMGRVLRNDRRFDLFMACQFLMGIGNLMVTPVLVVVMKDRFGLGYVSSIAIVATVPFMLMPISIPLWARLMDRVHIVHFRAVHSWVFVLSIACILVSTLSMQPWLLWIAAGLKGIAFGGGVLAWNLGHHDFARRHQASHYMGVHATLTGIRGLIAPTLAWSVYELLESVSPGSGGWVFAISLGLTFAGATGFVVMHLGWERPTPRSEPPLAAGAAVACRR